MTDEKAAGQIEFKAVDKAHFDAFIEAYPRAIERDVYGACEPPLITWNDFSDGRKWPDSVVARSPGGLSWSIADIEIGQPLPPYVKPVFPPNPDQKFKKGDRVRVVSKYDPGSWSSVLNGPMPCRYFGMIGTILSSYYEEFGGSNISDYTIDFDDYGSVAWFNDEQLEQAE